MQTSVWHCSSKELLPSEYADVNKQPRPIQLSDGFIEWNENDRHRNRTNSIRHYYWDWDAKPRHIELDPDEPVSMNTKEYHYYLLVSGDTWFDYRSGCYRARKHPGA